MDELAVFKRSLTADEVAFLHEHPRYLHDGNGARQSEAFLRRELRMRELERTARVAISRALPLEPTRSDLLKLTATDGHQTNTQRAVNLLLQFPPAGKEPPAAPKFPFDAKTAAAYQTDYAKWAGLPLKITNRQGVQLRLIPPGLFQMGSPDDEPGRSQDGRDESLYDVRLTRPFYLGVHEITVGQFDAFVRAASHKTNGERNDGGHAHDELAVWKHRPGTQWRKPGYAGPFVMLTAHPVVHVTDHAHPEAIGCIDETGMAKSGHQTAGVKRQYNGNRGKVENCINNVALAYSAPGFNCLLDARLYVPKEWIDDPARRKKHTSLTKLSFRRNLKSRWT
jgi:hypothetical protein